LGKARRGEREVNEIVRGILLVLTMAAIMVVVAATMIATTALAQG
jgi:hypothetical protein